MAVKVRRKVEIDIPELENRIKEARQQLGRSIRSISTSIGMSPAYWSRMESGTEVITEETLRRVEQVLGVDLGVSFDEGDRHD